MKKTKVKGAAALFLGMSFVVVARDSTETRLVELEGHVYAARDSKGFPRGPVVAAMVSTSLDSTTAVTDQDGHFHLRTGRRISGDEYFTLSVQSGGKVFRQRRMASPMRGSDVILMAPDSIDFIPR